MQHRDLTQQHWADFSLREQLANIGSEVIRAGRWKRKGNTPYATLAFHRALELIDLTLSQPLSLPALSEITRLREVLVDFYSGENLYRSSDQLWESYFNAFSFAAARQRETGKTS